MSRRVHNYPAVGSPERLDAIMSQGASMRRRRHLLGASGAAVAGVACVALVIGLIGLADSGTGPSIKADDNTYAGPGPSTPDQSTTPEPEFISFTQNGRELQIEINDPQTAIPQNPPDPATTSLSSQQCVTVTITNPSGPFRDTDVPFFAEGHACRQISRGEDRETPAVPLDLHATNELVGCAAVEERLPEPLEMIRQPGRTRFVAGLPDELGPGDYEIEIVGVSGFGDGCPSGAAVDGSTTTQPGTGPEDSTQSENSSVVVRSLRVN